ncbi:putative ribonuclease H-like domain, reverse transcriptase zinc-binding domain-containing protein [Rosa chinensis]|uniref:Putative ribonuclease H-like domain, reverse transcriptase zinc-binding domain-containing protein n=1 Tax=Rosa chinensis TaxID=74649 RepID=A0A2P6RYF3_ROSCH|nr:putative ribonuclease H-like domain, reverse transcriptase zinc-binding domain-containing protein [Rosa chinensis]
MHIPVGFEGSGPDRIIWGETSNGCFSVKSAYLALIKEENYDAFPWYFIWKLPIPPKLKTFMWMLCQGRILTNVERVKRRLASDPSCPICHEHPETLIHMLRDCPSAKNVWNGVVCLDTIARSMQLDWYDWLAANTHCNRPCFDGLKWCGVFVYTCWYIWKWRNMAVFNGNFYPLSISSKIILDAANDWKIANIGSVASRRTSTIFLSWSKPPDHYFKLNVDGARGPNGLIGAGGVLRDHSGTWISGFSASLGNGTVLQAEAWGLLLGLQLASKNRCQHLIVECDSEVLVNLINNGVNDLHPLRSVLCSCQFLRGQFLSCDIRHVYREINLVADLLSKDGVGADLGVHFMEQPPPQVINALLDDLCASPRSRTVICDF